MKTLKFASLVLAFAVLLLGCPHSTPQPAADGAVDGAAAEAGPADAGSDTPAAGVQLDTSRPTATWEVHFSPKGGCTDAIVKLIGEAKTSIRVLAYGLTSQPIVDAFVAAKGRGVDVQAVVDRSDWDNPAPTTKTKDLVAAKIPVLVDRKHVIAHNKVIIVDGLKVETGSFNYTTNAETGNAENCIILTNHALATDYTTNWTLHQGHSTPAQ